MPVGFIGLGKLGRAMAARLADDNTDLLAWNRTRSKAQSLRLPLAASPAEIGAHCDVTVLNLFDSVAVRDVLSGDSGLLAGDLNGKLIIDTTTNHYREVVQFHDMIAAAGGSYLEAPVLGSVVPASQGALTLLCSGSRSAYETALPLLQKLGKNLFYLETPGLASRMKLINNLVLGTVMGVLAEAVAIAERSGISTSQTIEVLTAGAGNSAVLNAKRQKLLENDFSPHFSVDAIHKDLKYLEDLLTELPATSRLAPATRELFHQALDTGLGDQDFSVVYQLAGEASKAPRP